MNIFIGNLSKQTTSMDLEEKFSKFGKITSCKVIKDFQTSESKGFGFIEMPDTAEANKAMRELNSIMVDGKKIIVNEARPKNNDNKTAPKSITFSSRRPW